MSKRNNTKLHRVAPYIIITMFAISAVGFYMTVTSIFEIQKLPTRPQCITDNNCPSYEERSKAGEGFGQGVIMVACTLGIGVAFLIRWRNGDLQW